MTWSRNAAVSSVPRPGRPAAAPAAARVIAHAAIRAVGRGPCHRRLRELERTGAIRGYRAVIDPEAIGLGFEVLVQVTMDREDASTIAEFERALAAIAEVRHAERLFGDPDYLIRVATASLAAYQALRDEKLGALPGVQRLTSTIVMKRVVADRPYPT
jgi:DNA-binding Lrp family transcriptional regulator